MTDLSLKGLFTAIISAMCTMFAAILNDIELWLRLSVGAAGLLSVGFTVRYYYFATLEKIENVKRLKSENQKK